MDQYIFYAIFLSSSSFMVEDIKEDLNPDNPASLQSLLQLPHSQSTPAPGPISETSPASIQDHWPSSFTNPMWLNNPPVHPGLKAVSESFSGLKTTPVFPAVSAVPSFQAEAAVSTGPLKIPVAPPALMVPCGALVISSSGSTRGHLLHQLCPSLQFQCLPIPYLPSPRVRVWDSPSSVLLSELYYLRHFTQCKS